MLIGKNKARPLPYDLRADGVISGGMLTVTFASRGAAGSGRPGPLRLTVPGDCGRPIRMLSLPLR